MASADGRGGRAALEMSTLPVFETDDVQSSQKMHAPSGFRMYFYRAGR